MNSLKINILHHLGQPQTIFDYKGKPVTQVPLSNRKDIRNAVEAMNSAKSWSHSTAHLRAQILYYLAENLSARTVEFTNNLQLLTGREDAQIEVEASIQRLFFYAAWSDKFDGSARSVPLKAIALVMNEAITMGIWNVHTKSFCSFIHS